ncbi:MAG: hypothetical protein JNM95_14680 [Chitinophagaceae bacterium]|nr:hypothetical protein [Chitinophagaceae bacterium]
MKKSFLVCFATLLFQYAYTQSDSAFHSKKLTPLVGVQANALFRQLFNFGNANNPVNNPYLLTFDLITPSKWGTHLGLGYTRNNSFTNDGNTKTSNYINDLYFRLGAERIIPLNKRFVATAHLHLLYNNLNSETVSEENFSSQYTKITTATQNRSVGGGPALSLRYKVANRVWIGTEANYYFRMGNTKSSVTTYIEFQGVPQGEINTQKSDNDFSNFTLNTPTAIFLILRL